MCIIFTCRDITEETRDGFPFALVVCRIDLHRYTHAGIAIYTLSRMSVAILTFSETTIIVVHNDLVHFLIIIVDRWRRGWLGLSVIVVIVSNTFKLQRRFDP